MLILLPLLYLRKEVDALKLASPLTSLLYDLKYIRSTQRNNKLFQTAAEVYKQHTR